MDAELIVVGGDLMGTRYRLGRGELRIGRGPAADIRLHEPGAAWEHCVVSPGEKGYRVIDRRTGAGTYVNGMRVTERALDEGDQISVGDTVILYREGAGTEHAPDQTRGLLQACAVQFLFRALARTESLGARDTIHGQLMDLIAEIVPCAGAAVLLGSDEEQIRTAAERYSSTLDLPAVAAATFREGSLTDADIGAVGAALWVANAPAGAIVAWFENADAARLSDYLDGLGAIAALAATALESQRVNDRLRTENLLLRERVSGSETGLAGESIAIHKLLRMIGRVAPQDASVLILGESGAGKELVARALHRLSPRAAGPFVAINCAALTETLLESELFGHEKGAFTGAVAQKKGKLEIAEGGTIFLDEIGELAPQMQVKLLRVLQQREFERVGGTKTCKLDVRILAATNRDLATDAGRGTFREDLYHRLNVVALRVPPLRERPDDVLPLARYFLDRASVRCGRKVTGFSPEAESCMTAYNWPGNVRELENAIERAVVLGETEIIQAEDLPETVVESARQVEGALQSSVSDAKRQLIAATWRQCGGDHNLTAEKLHIHPNSLRRLIRVLNLREML